MVDFSYFVQNSKYYAGMFFEQERFLRTGKVFHESSSLKHEYLRVYFYAIARFTSGS